MSTKQRRGKKETDADDGPDADDSSVPLEDQIARARAAILRAEAQAQELHKQWRTYLLRLSYLLVIISMHQMQQPARACIDDVKAFNQVVVVGEQEEERISGARVFVLVLGDAMPYVFAIAISASLAFFLILEEPGTFSDRRYMFANALLPPMVVMFFRNKDNPSCLNEDQLVKVDIDESDRSRSLPVVVVFHLIVTICYWFMDHQRQQQAKNLKMMEDLKRDLADARKGGSTKAAASSSGGGSKKASKKKN